MLIHAGNSLCCFGCINPSIYITSHCQQDSLGFLCLPGSSFCVTSSESDAKHKGSLSESQHLQYICLNLFLKVGFLDLTLMFFFTDCWAIHVSLCFCTGSCKVLELCSLGSPGFSWNFDYVIDFGMLCHF